jgi:glutathione peroxidase
MIFRIFIISLLLIFLAPGSGFATEEINMSVPTAHQFSFKDMEGNELNLSDYKGKPILIVNTASHCGLTPQYEGLQQLHEKYKDKGLVVIGVPSADFAGQEFDTEEEVREFTKGKFSVSFPLTIIESVKGESAHPFYKWAASEAGFLGAPKWNFHKYLIAPDGSLAGSFASPTKPLSDKIITAIEAQLK